MSDSNVAVGTSRYGLEVGAPGIRSVGPITFGPSGILFVADNVSAAIFAIDTGDSGAAGEVRAIDVEKVDTRLAAYLGCAREDIFIRDMAVHPYSQNVYLSLMRGTGDSATPVIAKIDGDGSVSALDLNNVSFSRTSIPDAPAEDDSRLDGHVVFGNREGEEIKMRDGSSIRIAREPIRTVTVTDMSYVDGTLLVAGASNEEFASTLRRIPFPFNGATESNSLEIFHVSHGKYETASPIRTFIPYAGNTSVLASYTCTPVVHFSLEDIKAGTQLKGRTVAELGSRSTPLDILSYKKDGEEFLLVANSSHPLMKIAASDVDRQESLTQPNEPLGVPRENLPQQGVSKMANLNGSYVLMMQVDSADNVDLHSYSTSML